MAVWNNLLDPLGYAGISDSAKARRNFDPYGGMPGGYPDYIGMEQGALQLAPQAQQMYGKVQLNTAPMDRFTMEAMREGPSRGSRLAMAGQRKDALTARDQARATAAGEAAGARTNLAMKGGLSAGAAERINTGAMNKALDMTQGANAAAAQNNRMIAMEDEKNRMGALAQAPSMQLSKAGFEQGQARDVFGAMEGDVNRLQMENTKRNAFNLGRYKEQMGAWAGGKQAEATQKSGKK